ncbi:MAG: hypothetical protein MHM6MM_008342 [Cercozoa sp. M6MM]
MESLTLVTMALSMIPLAATLMRGRSKQHMIAHAAHLGGILGGFGVAATTRPQEFVEWSTRVSSLEYWKQKRFVDLERLGPL